jgi:hypothetical protein
LRAYFVQQRPLREIATQFGYTYGTLRQVIHEFRSQCRAGTPPLCSRPRSTDVRPDPQRLVPRRPKSPTDAACASNQDDGCGVESRASSCSCRCWPTSASINSSKWRAIPARR